MGVGGCLQWERKTDGLCIGLMKIVFIVDKGESFVTLGEDARSVAFPIDDGLSHDDDDLKIFVEGFALHGDRSTLGAEEFEDLIDFVETEGEFALL